MQDFEKSIVNNFILRKHHLSEDTKIDNILQITEDLCGLHATGIMEPYIQLFNRMNHFIKEDLDMELYIRKNLGRIRGMRKTLFILTKELMEIVHPFVRVLTQKRDDKYLEYRDISLTEYEILAKKIVNLLENKELSTSEIKKALQSKKDVVAVISIMCDQTILIRGKPVSSWKDRRILYAPFKKYFPSLKLDKYTEEEAIALLIKKYLKSYGPVTEEDITWCQD